MNINIIGNSDVDNNYLDLSSSNSFSLFLNVFDRVIGNSKSTYIDHIFINCN